MATEIYDEKSTLTPFLPSDDTNLPAATEGVDDLDLWEQFHEAIQDLPAEEREVVSLVFYHGWSQLQVAELFGVNERTVRRRERAACFQLQQRLQGRLPGSAVGGPMATEV